MAVLESAGFEAMRERAPELAPDPAAVFKDSSAFFRRGRSGAGRELLARDELDRYRARTAALTPADLLDWRHRGPT